MEQGNLLQKRKLTWFLLFIGFCCLFGWLATNFILLTHFTNSGHFVSTVAVIRTLLMSLISTSFYAVIGVVTLWLGIKRYKCTERKTILIKGSIIPAAILTPVLGIAGIAVVILIPFVFDTLRTFIAGADIVQVMDSPDGQYQAYVIDKPCIDGPNHHLFVKNLTTNETAFVTNLPADVDFNKEIIWSPFSDLVAFRSHFRLIVYSYKNGKSEDVNLGGEKHYRKNGTFWVDYEDVLKLSDLQFPQPGIFAYQLEGDDEIHTVSLN